MKLINTIIKSQRAMYALAIGLLMPAVFASSASAATTYSAYTSLYDHVSVSVGNGLATSISLTRRDCSTTLTGSIKDAAGNIKKSISLSSNGSKSEAIQVPVQLNVDRVVAQCGSYRSETPIR